MIFIQLLHLDYEDQWQLVSFKNRRREEKTRKDKKRQEKTNLIREEKARVQNKREERAYKILFYCVGVALNDHISYHDICSHDSDSHTLLVLIKEGTEISIVYSSTAAAVTSSEEKETFNTLLRTFKCCIFLYFIDCHTGQCCMIRHIS